MSLMCVFVCVYIYIYIYIYTNTVIVYRRIIMYTKIKSKHPTLIEKHSNKDLHTYQYTDFDLIDASVQEMSCAQIYIYIYIYIYMCVCVCVCVCVVHTFIPTNIFINKHTNIFAFHFLLYIYLQTYQLRKKIFICIHLNIYKCVKIHTHTHILVCI